MIYSKSIMIYSKSITICLVIIVSVCLQSSNAQGPPGCTNSGNYVYTCIVTTPYTPFTNAQISAPNFPQYLNFTRINGTSMDNVITILDNLMARATNDVAKILTYNCLPNGELSLTADTFAGSKVFEYISIQNCVIQTLPASLFSKTENLKGIYFRNCVIGSIDAAAFNGLTFKDEVGAGILRFEGTNIATKKFPTSALKNAKNLRAFGLSQCEISSITRAVFSGCGKVQSLDLSYNKFTTLTSGVFDDMPQLGSVVMHDISWECSCTNTWLFNWAVWNYIDLDADLTCESPAQFSNMRLFQYNVTYCAPEVIVDPIIITAGFFLVLCLILLVAALALAVLIKKYLTKKRSHFIVEPEKEKDSDEEINEIVKERKELEEENKAYEEKTKAALMDYSTDPSVSVRNRGTKKAEENQI